MVSRRVEMLSSGDTPVTVYSYETSATYTPYEESDHGVFFIPIVAGETPQTVAINIAYRVEMTTTSGSVVTNEQEGTAVIALDNKAKAGESIALRVTLTQPA